MKFLGTSHMSEYADLKTKEGRGKRIKNEATG
jgi:hypothetical protein